MSIIATTWNCGTFDDFKKMNINYFRSQENELVAKTMQNGQANENEVVSQMQVLSETVSIVAQGDYMSKIFNSTRPVFLLQEYYDQSNGVKSYLYGNGYIIYNPETLHFVKETVPRMIEMIQPLAKKYELIGSERLKKGLSDITSAFRKLQINHQASNLQTTMSELSIPHYEAKHMLETFVKQVRGKISVEALENCVQLLDDAKKAASDTVIALPEDYVFVSHESFVVEFENKAGSLRKQVAAVVAIPPNQKNKILFVSIHAPGFDFECPHPDDLSTAETFMEQVVNHCEKIAKEKACDFIIIGADMNAQADLPSGAAIFAIPAKKGFTHYTSPKFTNINYRRKQSGERSFIENKIDYIFIKSCRNKLKEMLNPRMIKTVGHSLTPATYKGDIKLYPSDHAPLTVMIS